MRKHHLSWVGPSPQPHHRCYKWPALWQHWLQVNPFGVREAGRGWNWVRGGEEQACVEDGTDIGLLQFPPAKQGKQGNRLGVNFPLPLRRTWQLSCLPLEAIVNILLLWQPRNSGLGCVLSDTSESMSLLLLLIIIMQDLHLYWKSIIQCTLTWLWAPLYHQ